MQWRNEGSEKEVFITLTIEAAGSSVDIRIDSEQKIGEGLRVLQESGKLPLGSIPDYFRSHMNQTMVSAWKTFGEEHVFNGDILSAVE